MNKDDFLADQDVAGFLDFFSCCLRYLEVDYHTLYPRILPGHRHFHVTGVTAAHANYAWPAINTFIGPSHPALYDWITTSGFLHMARTELQAAIAARNDPATWDAVSKILVWGLGQRAPRVLARMHGLYPGHPGVTISAYLAGVQAALNLGIIDTAQINAALIPYASSGMAKVHSLASTDGMVIFDSRVAATVGECINEYLRRNHAHTIPAPLKIFVESNHGKVNPKQRVPSPLANGVNHPGFVRDYRWIECQIRVSWIFEEVLTRNPDIFTGLPMLERMHHLEAACFMMGAYLQSSPFAGRSFNFTLC